MPHVNDLHEQHDPILVVSLASGDLATADRDRATAQSLVETCADCARLHDDVLAIAAATKALPARDRAPATSGSRRSRRRRLRPAGWRRFFAGPPRALFSRQLGVGLTTLGIAGLLISSIVSLPLGRDGGCGRSARAPRAAPALRAAVRGRAPDRTRSRRLAPRHPSSATLGRGEHPTVAGAPPAASLSFRANAASPPAASTVPRAAR